MDSIVITGAAGYIGSCLLEKLRAVYGHIGIIIRKTTDISRIKHCLENIDVFYDNGSIDDMADFLKSQSADCVIHLATKYITTHKPEHIYGMMESNLCFGIRILEAMKMSGVSRIIYSRTAWQHYQNEGYNPANLYAATKQAFEDIMKYYTEAEGFHSMILEIYDTYGEFDPRKKVINMLKEHCITGESVCLSPGEQKLDYLYIDDITNGFQQALALIEKQEEKDVAFALSSDQVYSLKEVVEAFMDIYGNHFSVIWGGFPYKEREIYFPYRKLERLEGWIPQYDLRSGLQRMYKMEHHVQRR